VSDMQRRDGGSCASFGDDECVLIGIVDAFATEQVGKLVAGGMCPDGWVLI
jgi:hypothetical protein